MSLYPTNIKSKNENIYLTNQKNKQKSNHSIPSVEAVEFKYITIAEYTPKSIKRSMLRAQRDRVFEEEPDIGKLRLETGEHRRERLLVVRDEVMTASLIVIELANNAEFELFIVAHDVLRLRSEIVRRVI